MNKVQQDRWDELLIGERFRKPIYDIIDPSNNDHRNPFEKDYSRLVFSPPFRRMQDKTQVFPLNDSDFVRTRLTHSIEVSTIARGIAMSIEHELIRQHYLRRNKKGHIVSLLSTACLVHDIGNPPFGHFGEIIVQDFFKKYLIDINDYTKFLDRFQRKWTKEELEDLKNFDGNVQTFRILKKLQYYKDEHSYNLTYATLACIVKYPYSSTTGNLKNSINVSQHKFGFFQSEKAYFEEIWSKLKLPDNTRHPITFLVEAADDITYLACDIEDGCKRNIIDIEILMDFMKIHLNKNESHDKELFEVLEIRIKGLSINEIKNQFDSIVQTFRVSAQGLMIESVVDTFMQNHDRILKGEYLSNLLEDGKAKNIKTLLQKLSKLIHKNKEIIEMEIVGEKVLTGLLHAFVDAINNPDKKDLKRLDGKIYELTSSSYRYIFENYKYSNNESYANCQFAIDSIAGMTDNYALSLYQKISGIKI